METVKKTAPKLSKSQQDHLATLTSTAAKIRYLLSEGQSRGDVSRTLGIRYQWVRNVELQPLKKA
jgi:hypothetical protein